MKTSSLIWLVLVIVVAVSVASIWLYPSSQDFMASNKSWNGLKDFSRKFEVINLNSLDDLSTSPGKEVLICIPYQEYNNTDLSRIKQFTEQGGDLLLMDDFGFGNDILAYLGTSARFDHSLLLDPLFCYKNQNLPYITDFSSDLQAAGIASMAFNHATVLRLQDDIRVLARSSLISYLDVKEDGQQDSSEPTGPFTVAARFEQGQGTVTLVSDPSLIINAMETQNDNSAFIHYLVSSGGQPEHLFLDRSHLNQSPLDVSQIGLNSFRQVFSNPYMLLCLIALIFILVIYYSFRKGEIVGQ